MLKSVYIKLSLIITLMFLGITFAYIKYDMFTLMGYHIFTADNSNNEDKLKSKPVEDKEIDETNSPVYFSVFKFVNNFAPAKQKN